MKIFAALFAAVLVVDLVVSLEMEEEEMPSFIPIPIFTVVSMAIKVLKMFVCKNGQVEVRIY